MDRVDLSGEDKIRKPPKMTGEHSLFLLSVVWGLVGERQKYRRKRGG